MPKPQPEGDYITREAPRAGAIAVHVKAELLNLTIVPSSKIKTAAVKLAGPLADKVTAEWKKDGWHIEWPPIPPSIITGNGVTVIRGGKGGVTIGNGDVYVAGRRVTISGRGASTVIMGNGSMQVNRFSGRDGFSVTSYGDSTVVSGGAGSADEMPETFLYVPANSEIYSAVDDGEIVAGGLDGTGLSMLAQQGRDANLAISAPVSQLAISTHNGNVNVSGPTGTVQVGTHNGHVHIGHALGQTGVQTHNGGIDVHAMDSVMVQAVSHNGSVRVTAAPGTTPMVQANSYNGSVSKP